ncbi:NAD(P)H-dependent glycerol-3-phosphate dehydrogenase [Cumulibacter soli]|uniref:NAD(P)H-dependent glycerol-3-phosphate dehydrogenase n=1 Tax=Cumulibacter soli TaxID=2546344 RepID=UPI001068379B|nr:NAD(P)H-dependent glycerol-3-phosphate dehydrogenase [Cumulibacter soli]
MSTRAAVMGAGSWGTAFAKVLADAGASVQLWARREDVARQINETHRNRDYFGDIDLPATLRATSDPAIALTGADLVVLAIPSQTLRENLLQWRQYLGAEATLVSLMKGIELGTMMRMSQVIAEVADVAAERVAVVTGPNLAREIALEQPAATVIACADHERAVEVQRTCQTSYMRPYTSTDVIGCELGGAVKNVIALACGMAEGMGFGDNTKATLMTRGLAEISRLGVKMGAEAVTFAGLAGIGDLAATCISPLSRNRSFGELMGSGASLDEAIAATRQTAEGVKSCRSILDLARANDVEMPITEAIVMICHEGRNAADIVPALMGRRPKREAS